MYHLLQSTRRLSQYIYNMQVKCYPLNMVEWWMKLKPYLKLHIMLIALYFT